MRRDTASQQFGLPSPRFRQSEVGTTAEAFRVDALHVTVADQ
jgi:hypothetical protein